MLTSFANEYSVPGMTAQYTTITSDILWGRAELQIYESVLLSGAARDAGNTPTTLLRPGLLLGQVTATKKWKEWNPTGTDGSEFIAGVLLTDISAQLLATNEDRFMGFVLKRGMVKASKLIVPGAASATIVGAALEYVIRNALAKNFLLDDKPQWPMGGYRKIRVVTDDTTVTAADHLTLFIANKAGTVTFTLPTMLEGLEFEFTSLTDNAMAVVSTPADTLLTVNDIAADSITLGTSGEIIGGTIRIVGVNTGAGGLKALVIPHLYETQTVTVATA